MLPSGVNPHHQNEFYSFWSRAGVKLPHAKGSPRNGRDINHLPVTAVCCCLERSKLLAVRLPAISSPRGLACGTFDDTKSMCLLSHSCSRAIGVFQRSGYPTFPHVWCSRFEKFDSAVLFDLFRPVVVQSARSCSSARRATTQHCAMSLVVKSSPKPLQKG